MKIHILYPFKDGPFGGANQFLKAIREYFIKIESYTDNINEADILLFNSSPVALEETVKLLFNIKKKFPKKIYVNRIDGPVFYIRDKNLFVDKAFYKFNDSICDGTIFQSKWSKEKNIFLGMKKNYFETIILNAPDPDIFNKYYKNIFSTDRKIKLVATSWSSNMKKGFDIYKWIDENLDFEKYEMTFIGNSPFKFKNIKLKEPMNSKDLSIELKENDIFVFASKIEACSNSLIEALHCGLPAIGYNSSSTPEIICKGGLTFNNVEEIPQKLELLIKNYNEYQKNIKLPKIDEVGELYFQFLKKIYNEKEIGFKLKKSNILDYIKINTYLCLWKLEEKILAIKRLFYR